MNDNLKFYDELGKIINELAIKYNMGEVTVRNENQYIMCIVKKIEFDNGVKIERH
jgi:hypothetical protein